MTNALLAFENDIRQLFHQKLIDQVVYHNIDHTISVVTKVNEIAVFLGLCTEDQQDLFVAAWLHDVGYWAGIPEGHEERGAEFAASFLPSYGFSKVRIERIQHAILATKVPQSPQDLISSILCDADLYHLSSDQFYAQTILLKEEKEKLENVTIDLKEWLGNSATFLHNHHYHTSFAAQFMQAGKDSNLSFLENKLKTL